MSKLRSAWNEFLMRVKNHSPENKVQPAAYKARGAGCAKPPVFSSSQGQKAEVKVKGKPSWFCKGPSSCAFFFFSFLSFFFFCCTNNHAVFTARSLAVRGGLCRPPTTTRSRAGSLQLSACVRGRSGSKTNARASVCLWLSGEAFVAFWIYIYFASRVRKCVRKAWGLRQEACRVLITTPDKCSRLQQ